MARRTAMAFGEEPPAGLHGACWARSLGKGCHGVCSGKGRALGLAGCPCGLVGWCSSRQSGGGRVGAAPTPAALCSNVGSREMLLRLASIRGFLCQPPSPANVKK